MDRPSGNDYAGSILLIAWERDVMANLARNYVSAAMAMVMLGLAPHATGAASPACIDAASRQLDFWVGNWTVGAAGSSPTAHSKVYLALDKCMVIESWDGGRGHRGENMFAYSADDKSWHGLFVDNEGRVHVFSGGKASPGQVEFTGPSAGPKGATVLNRVTIVRIRADKVEQTWEKSTDNGVTWSVAFRGEYSRAHP
ncbi:hypothetical protein DWU98_06740 [Dyella monticola]|uniref:DUF1579 domain-containing protein n=2 Tax=Dyella monticola TaxID=1927958 RepID=A0A370X3M7_9GAMM|nr:hypothetical protein DWU98_06740 [Dyella monticola]